MTSFFDKVLRDPGSGARKGARQPWWQMTRTPRQGFILSAVYLVIGLGQMVRGLVPRVHVWALVIGGGYVTLGVVLLAGTVGLYLREQSDAAARYHGEPGFPPSS